MKKILLVLLITVCFILSGCNREEIELQIEGEFKLDGESTIEIELNEIYEEPGYTAVDIYSGDDLSKYVSINGDVDSSKEGTYIITYSLSVKGHKQELTREVIVKPYKSSDISLKLVGSSTTKVEFNSKFIDPFVVAVDEKLGLDISDLVEVSGVEDIDTTKENKLYPISYILEYNGVIKTVLRTVQITSDTGAELSIVRDTNTYNTYLVGESYIEYGVSITDKSNGSVIDEYDITNNFVYDYFGNIKAGTYNVIYTTELRGVEYNKVRSVTFKEVFKDFQIVLDSTSVQGGINFNIWDIKAMSFDSEKIQIKEICYFEDSQNNISCNYDLGYAKITTTTDELEVLSFTYVLNNKEIEGVI